MLPALGANGEAAMRSAILAAITLSMLGTTATPAFAETIHRRGLFTVTIPNLRMNDANPNADGPFASRFFDLDGARQLQGYLPPVDAELTVNARRATFIFGVPPGRRLVSAGPNPPSYLQCARLLSSAMSGAQAVQRAPTDYRCIRTSDGRIARFRVYRWRGDYKPDSFVDMIIELETRVWNP